MSSCFTGREHTPIYSECNADGHELFALDGPRRERERLHQRAIDTRLWTGTKPFLWASRTEKSPKHSAQGLTYRLDISLLTKVIFEHIL